MTPVFDTNILIDYLNGIQDAAGELARYPAAAISAITWIEMMAGADDASEERTLRSLLGRFRIVAADRPIAETAFLLRRQHRLRVPDAIIWATARNEGTMLITRNTKDFPETEADIRVPYQLPT